MDNRDFRQLMNRIRWQGNKRTIPAPKRVPEDVINEAATLFESGAFDEAVQRLEAQPSELLANDSRALVILGLSYFGQDDYDGALEALDSSAQILNEQKAKIEINRANVLKVKGDLNAALEAAYAAQRLLPKHNGPYLTIISILEYRYGPGYRSELKSIIDEMNRSWPEWKNDAEFWDFLLNDADYASLRRDKDFFVEIFGKSDLPIKGGG